MMMTIRQLSLPILLALLVVLNNTNALSTQGQNQQQLVLNSSSKPRGCAATPLLKQKIAVMGAGGYLGANVFGFLQRAAHLYGTGIGGPASPRNICATFLASQCMNKVLGKNFCLSYAGEQHVKLTDMTRVDAIATRLDGYSAVVMGTMYRLEPRPITSGTYEKGPNDKTLEFYLDDTRRGETVGPESFEMETHLQLFQNTLEACTRIGVQHMVILETPQTENPAAFLGLLKGCRVPFTYIRCQGPLIDYTDHTFWKGIQGDLTIETLESNAVEDSTRNSIGRPIYREDLAALICQSLQSLPWSTSRYLSVGSTGDLAGAIQVAKGRQDRVWCANSQLLAKKLDGVN